MISPAPGLCTSSHCQPDCRTRGHVAHPKSPVSIQARRSTNSCWFGRQLLSFERFVASVNLDSARTRATRSWSDVPLEGSRRDIADFEDAPLFRMRPGARLIIRPGRANSLVVFGTSIGPMSLSNYMAPEQVCGVRGDARTYMYAIGVLPYELLTGAVPCPAQEAPRCAAAEGSV